MKKILGVLLALALGLSSVYAEALLKKGNAGNLEEEFSNPKGLTVGMNKISIKVMDGAKEVKDAKVSIVASMPAMTGMHAMEEKAGALYVGNAYMADVAFSMRGTWQISIVVETKDGAKQRLKSSVNL